jgi:hypothetical protein
MRTCYTKVVIQQKSKMPYLDDDKWYYELELPPVFGELDDHDLVHCPRCGRLETPSTLIDFRALCPECEEELYWFGAENA